MHAARPPPYRRRACWRRCWTTCGPGPTRTVSAKPRSRSRWPPASSTPARRWAEGTSNAQHWLALIDVADPARRGGRLQSLRPIEDLAVRGRLSAGVAAPAGDRARRARHRRAGPAVGCGQPQRRSPSGGYLPDTGVLADLSQSAKRGDAGRTILLVMRTLGADGPEGANILALGDAIRALKRVGPGGGCAPPGPRGAAARLATAGRQLR